MTYPNLLTTDEKAELEDAEELQAHRDGIGHLAEDPMHAGQPVHEELNWADGEPHYWLQVTHQDMPLWTCAACQKVTLTVKGEPQKCAGCGAVDTCGPLLYQARVYCRSWTPAYGGQYDGPCLIAGSNGCECDEER